jgi:hypothetical protein
VKNKKKFLSILPIRAAIECGAIFKINLVLQQASYRDFDIVDDLNPKIPLADLPANGVSRFKLGDFFHR